MNMRVFSFSIMLLVMFFYCSGYSQNLGDKKDQYQIGPDERLLITVHIWGEIRNPGGYLVPDDTDILELISRAGGPTEYSNLKDIKITRGLSNISNVKRSTQKNRSSSTAERLRRARKRVIKVNLKKLLDNEKYYYELPQLQPGDVVRIGRNVWYRWQAVIRVVSQIALIVQVWYWYSRIE